MIISPPFLPAPDADERAFLAAAMPDALDVAPGAAGAPLGSYPLTTALTWHNGLHLQAPRDANHQPLPVRAIADGTVIFRRNPVPHSPDAAHPQNYNPYDATPAWTDNGIVILRHVTEIGATGAVGTALVYFSVYMHLARIEPGVAEGKPVWRKDAIGGAGSILGAPNQIHFETCLDAANLQHLLGPRWRCSWTEPDAAPSVDGRTDSVYGSLYIHLPAGTPTHAVKPATHLGGGAAHGALTQGQWVEIRYRSGNAYLRSYRSRDAAGPPAAQAGDPIGAELCDADFEYRLYAEATARHRSLPAAVRAASSPSGWYELLRFGRNLGGDPLPTGAAHWREIPTATGTVWADLNAPGSVKWSDADFPPFLGWQCFDDDTSHDDQRCDSAQLKRLIRDPADPQSVQQRRTLARRLGRTDVRERLRRAICQFPTEWDRATIAQRYAWLKTDPDFPVEEGRAWNLFEAHARAISFDGLPADYRAAIWHVHPRAFIGQMRQCGWLSTAEMKRVYPDAKYPIRALSTLGKTPDSVRETYRLHINRCTRKYLLDSAPRRAHFFGEGAVESAHLSLMTEGSVNFTRNPGHACFQPETSGPYTPSSHADYLYYLEGRLGNIEPGDGPKYRGRGMKQLTGRENYAKYWVYRGWLDASSFHAPWWNPARPSKAPRIPDPERLSVDHFNAIDAGAWFWEAGSSLNKYRSINSVIPGLTISRATVLPVASAINGVNKSGVPNGLDQRLSETLFVAHILLDDV